MRSSRWFPAARMCRKAALPPRTKPVPRSIPGSSTERRSAGGHSGDDRGWRERVSARQGACNKLRNWCSPRQRYWASPFRWYTVTSADGWRSQRSSCRLSCPTYTPTSRPTTASLRCAHDRLGQHHLPVLRRPRQAGDRHHAPWAGSSWYFLRYMDPHNDKALASKEALEYWSPVDWYNGGMEHTTLHLLYSRFWHKFLYDIGVVPTKEPYAKRTSHGMIPGETARRCPRAAATSLIRRNCRDLRRGHHAPVRNVYRRL